MKKKLRKIIASKLFLETACISSGNLMLQEAFAMSSYWEKEQAGPKTKICILNYQAKQI